MKRINIMRMPKYKRICRTFLHIWLFYYFVNAIKVHECQQLNDVEFINPMKNEEIVESHEYVDKEIIYEPIEPKSEFNNFDEIDDGKNVNLNINNNLPDTEPQEIPSSFTEIKEQIVSGEMHLRLSESPFLLRQDLNVQQNAKLIIDPGVTIYFAPMIGITVEGQLKAIGTTEHVITFSSQPNSGYPDHPLKTPDEMGARLVDGPSPLEGRLQLMINGKWRSVCSNSRNWTIPDYETVCRQMGFQGGRFWNWIEKLQNFQPRLLYEEPECKGVEHSVFECQWNRHQLGAGVCDYHNDIGVQCLPLLETASSHWRGIKFMNAESTRVLSSRNTVYDSQSHSELRHVNIIRAGAGRNRMVSAAVESLGVPPVLDHVTIDYSAFTGINVTRSQSSFNFHEVTVRRSRGFGIFVNSSYGAALMENCQVNENGADGIRYVGHDLRYDERTDRSDLREFCTLAITAGQTYPIELQIEQTAYSPAKKECEQKFSTRPGNVLTVHFVNFMMAKNESAEILVTDGSTDSDRVLMEWSIRNHTRVQSVMSTREYVYIRFKAQPRSHVLAYLRVTSGPWKAYDLNVTSSLITDNGGRGVAVDNLRSSVHIHKSAISNNNHVAGFHITSGAGDVNVTESKISFNEGAGINITYYGGHRNISRSSLSNNKEYGFSVWLNQTTPDRAEYLPINQTTVIEYSRIIRNLEVGVLHGNYCGDYWVNITGNLFNESFSNGIDIQTCWFDRQDGKRLKLQIGHNEFQRSAKIGIIISPALNIDGVIEHNHFYFGKYGAILIRNDQFVEFYDLFRTLPARFTIQQNFFMRNSGVFVASLGLNSYTDRDIHSILFMKNFVQNNKIQEPFGRYDGEAQPTGGEGMNGEGRLNPRSRVAAPIVISSSNVDVYRNIIYNRDSNYEIGSQVSDQSQILNCTYNWLGSKDEEKVFDRLFHRKDRYDLAKIEYLPFLLHHSNPGTILIHQFPTYTPRFHVDGSDKVGGEVDGQEILPAGSYEVERDINIRPGGKLILQAGVTLNFAPSVGMMVAGKLEARGIAPDDILFTLKREPVMVNETTEMIDGTDIETETEPIVPKNLPPPAPIRLLGGKTEHEGRLQVMIDGKWGTVCDYGWTIIDAALVCHQLGLALNPLDWRLERSEIPGAGTQEEILLSHVRCTEHDTDITKCRSERKSEFENSCTHEMDVGVRCYEGAWAGVRFGVLADRADIQYVTVKKAGLFDYSTNVFKPAIQLDFARHNFDHLRVVENLYDGLGVLYSDIFAGGTVNNVRNSEFSNNNGNGISLKQLGLQVQGSIIKNNLGSGVSHDPVIGAYEQRELAGWFKLAPDFIATDFVYPLTEIPTSNTQQQPIDIDQFQMKYLITKKVIGEEIEQIIRIRCQPGYVIGIQLLNPIENRSTEEIYIYDSQTVTPKSEVFQVKRDLSMFPFTTTTYGIIMKYKSGPNALGGAVLTLSSITAPQQTIYNRIIRGPVPTLHMSSTKITNNWRGLTATYYNRYLGEKGEHFLRKANESMLMRNCEVNYNREEAVFIHAPFWDVHVSNLSEITLHINRSSVSDNGRGIRQFSKDLRSSNNLFHYVMQDSTIERNAAGGLEISLPYVWQYNENFTHSVWLGNNTWRRNEKFGITIDGHYAEVNVTGNKFTDNSCQNGLLALRGMEKKIKMEENLIQSNTGRFMVEFNSDSQSEILGEVFAVFRFNELKDNKAENRRLQPGARSFFRGTRSNPIDPSCVIGFGGVQKVQIIRNLISRNLQDYDLVAGVKSARLGNFLECTENWWGSLDPHYIEQRIFDFDDWNNHAEAIWRPFLIEDNTLGSLSVSYQPNRTIDFDDFGGRITEDLTLRAREFPYIIKRDITVMPDVTLNIGGGVEMEFAPNVGILVLGTLNARGGNNARIKMRPITTKKSEDFSRIERSVENMVTQDSIRLCTNRNCTNDLAENQEVREGFLEYFNHTTLQWIPICDRRFTERNAQVVCRELGFDPLNVYFGHDRRIEYHTNSLTRIWTWVEPFECHGDESRMEQCPERLNGQLYGRRHDCKWDDEFVFISCHSDIDKNPYWGGIRFANSEFEDRAFENRVDHRRSPKKPESFIEYIEIERAGLLHGEKSPAVQSIAKTPIIRSIFIRNSAYHGINLVSPRDAMHLDLIQVENALGEGVNAISLTGEGRESDDSSFTPLRNLDLPYNIFSIVDICDVSKVITIEERLLVYYKYDNNPVNCVKIFKSAFAVKPLGFRLLQSNLFNHSKEYGRPDSLMLFDGDIYNYTAKHLGTVHAQSPNEKHLFKTFEPMLSVRLIASGAPSRHGFIAEIVTLPISAIGFNRDAQHNISNCEISGTIGSAITYHSAGEVSPLLTLEKNRIIGNGKQLYGNFSTCEAAVRIDVQNMQSLFFRNNLVQENQGGLAIKADSRGSATALKAFINNNVYVRNKNRPSLYTEGRSGSPYQEVIIYNNYFTQNMAGYEDVIVLRQVVSNFTHNYIHSNMGGRIIEISGFDKVRLPIYQTTTHNGFYSNIATDWRGRTTVVAGTAGQSYLDNIFFNPDNDYEMITVNRSLFDVQFWNSTRDIYKTKIDATHNFWNWNETLAVSSRIRDRSDDPTLLEVQYLPLHMNNQSILDGGKCPPGWNLVFDTCYMYVGAPMTFHEARDFCRSDNASLPFIRDDKSVLFQYLQKQMKHLRYFENVWVQDYDYLERCTAFVYQTVEFNDCNMKNAFICEIDPKIIINPLSWQADFVAIGVIGLLALGIPLLCCICFCWYKKSKTRHMERLQRRNSIRQSIRSLNMIDPQGGSMRRRYMMNGRSTDSLSKSTGTDYKKMISNGSFDSMDKSVNSFTDYEININPNPQPRYNDYTIQPSKRQSPPDTPQKSKAYGLPPTPPLPLNSFELAYRNDGFRDNSTVYSSATRNNSVSTAINDDTPIIHQVDNNEDYNSDYYGNASTLPIRAKGENLSFLNELKNRLPEYEAPRINSGHSSFMRDPNSNHSSGSQSSTPPYDKKTDKINLISPKPAERIETRRPNAYNVPVPEIRRPDSYLKAVKTRESIIPKSEYGRPKTVYESSESPPQRPSQPPPAKPYTRSKSEAILETNFDEAQTPSNLLTSDNRSHSQPLETEF